MHSLLTAIVGAGVNVGLNFLLIPVWGVNGSVVAMLVSYFVVFLIRMADTKRYVRIRVSIFRMSVNTALLLVQALIMIFEFPLWILWEILLTALMLVLNAKEILESVMKILHRGERLQLKTAEPAFWKKGSSNLWFGFVSLIWTAHWQTRWSPLQALLTKLWRSAGWKAIEPTSEYRFLVGNGATA